MPRVFYDLGICKQLIDSLGLEKFLELLRELRFKGFAIVNLNGREVTRDFASEVAKASSEHGLDFVTRVDILTDSRQEFKRMLSKFRRRFELVVVRPLSVEVARDAATDARVDLISFPPDRMCKMLDPSQIRLMREGGKALELPFSECFRFMDVGRALRRVFCVMEKCRFGKVPLVITSRATCVREVLHAYEALSLYVTFGFSREDAYRNFKHWVMERLDINRKKLAGIIPFEGVEVVGFEGEEEKVHGD